MVTVKKRVATGVVRRAMAVEDRAEAMAAEIKAEAMAVEDRAEAMVAEDKVEVMAMNHHATTMVAVKKKEASAAVKKGTVVEAANLKDMVVLLAAGATARDKAASMEEAQGVATEEAPPTLTKMKSCVTPSNTAIQTTPACSLTPCHISATTRAALKLRTSTKAECNKVTSSSINRTVGASSTMHPVLVRAQQCKP
jgi:hypothetical protein